MPNVVAEFKIPGDLDDPVTGSTVEAVSLPDDHHNSILTK